MREMKDSGIEWIGAIPAAWGVHRIASHFQEIKEKNTANAYSNALQFKMGKIIAKPQKWDEDETNETYSAYTVVHPNTIMINGLNLEFDFVTQRVARVECNGIITSAYIALSPRDDINAEYICYLLKSYDACRAFHSMGRGLRKILSYSELKNKPIVVPPLAEQERIAAFLDAECAEIDAVLEKTRASIEEYKKLKQAVITQAVTKGIRGDRPMKDSGSVWFEEIPCNWVMKRIKYLFHVKKDIAGKEGYTVLSITQSGIKPKDLSKNEGQLADNYSHYQLLNPGDFAMNHMDLLTGWVDISKYSGVTSPDYRVFVLDDTEKNDSSYYLYLMQMCYFNRIFYGLGQGVSGMGRWRLQADKFLNFPVVVPPVDEQKEIASYLNEKCSGIEVMIAKKQQYLTEIENYKKSLIYEYVTGKKEVV